GPLDKHGFARRMPWKAIEIINEPNRSQAHLQFNSNEKTMSLWPHLFKCDLRVTIEGSQMEVVLTVTNLDDHPFSFSSALHTYLQVADIQQTKIQGLFNKEYIDSAHDDNRGIQSDPDLTFSDELDRIFLQPESSLQLWDGQRFLKVEQSGFFESVIWNPWLTRGAALSDLEPEGYRRFVCIEAAAVHPPIELKSGESWSGIQRLFA
ncbi:MAG: D-hexose-6-phosphate mutarotase, partial [Anaerolineae bacterium]|nr:D-hexose-6-phosphate mutarotase [Anaerolineae bacterium]